MSKPTLKEPYRTLEHQVVETMMAAYKAWGLEFPKSYSDYQACARALIEMFDIKRRPLAFKIPLERDDEQQA
ncbi:MAG: hypothetical protein DRP09_19520 [Candidatus Thorarchaeota archaeon]|nr:MAG: hypothetical protein DRP09_19520 [Candidatus Thorarchaeota archaeon]